MAKHRPRQPRHKLSIQRAHQLTPTTKPRGRKEGGGCPLCSGARSGRLSNLALKALVTSMELPPLHISITSARNCVWI
eukprot:1161529-Pelagomonas_calceolata.AAC.21